MNGYLPNRARFCESLSDLVDLARREELLREEEALKKKEKKEKEKEKKEKKKAR